RDRALRLGQSRRLVVILGRHLSFQRKFVHDGADEYSVARRHHTAWRSLFSHGLGLARRRARTVEALVPGAPFLIWRVTQPPHKAGFHPPLLAVYNRPDGC